MTVCLNLGLINRNSICLCLVSLPVWWIMRLTWQKQSNSWMRKNGKTTLMEIHVLILSLKVPSWWTRRVGELNLRWPQGFRSSSLSSKTWLWSRSSSLGVGRAGSPRRNPQDPSKGNNCSSKGNSEPRGMSSCVAWSHFPSQEAWWQCCP